MFTEVIRKQDTILKPGDISTKNEDLPPKPCFKYLYVKPKTKIFPQNLASNISM